MNKQEPKKKNLESEAPRTRETPQNPSRQVTFESVKKMSDKELKIAVAEIDGWKYDSHFVNNKHWHKGTMIVRELHEFPDYPRDLNAAIEAARLAGQDLMDADQWERFGKALLDSHPHATLDDMNGGIEFGDLATFVSDLTARTICEALVLCLSSKEGSTPNIYDT